MVALAFRPWSKLNPMIRLALSLFTVAFVLATPALARQRARPAADTGDAATSEQSRGKDGGKNKNGKPADTKGKPVQVGSFGDWGAYTSQGKGKTCYALAKPKERAPAGLQRDEAYVFISSRPAENVRNEVSIIMGFPMKDNAEAKAEIGAARFDLISKGTNAWVKDPAKEGEFVESLRKGRRLVIKAASAKGSTTTDSYSLAGLPEALARLHKECP